jgi:ferritin
MNNLNDEDSSGRDDRARQFVHDFEDERHDEYDDADQGGEG